MLRQPGRSTAFVLLIWVSAHLCGHSLCLSFRDFDGHRHATIEVSDSEVLEATGEAGHNPHAPCTCCCCRILCSDFRTFFSISTPADFSALFARPAGVVPSTQADPLYHPPDIPPALVQ